MFKHCPSCGSEGIELKGDRYICPDCTMIFVIKEDGSTKVVDYDPIGKIADKVIEKMKAGEKKESPAVPAADPVPAEAEKVTNETSDGFINW